MRVVVCALGAVVRPLHLPPSRFVPRRWIYGGERTMYEIAAAAAVAGHQVELRGDLLRPAFDQIVGATDARIATDLPPRRPEADEVIVFPEGITDPLPYLAAALSPARAVMALLAPPGLFGPALDLDFQPADPLSVDPLSVGRPEDYRWLSEWGFELWTNSPGVSAEAAAAGVACSFIGTGQPLPFPDPGPKTHDVALLEANRWAPLAHRVAADLGRPVREIPEGDRDAVLRELAGTRILIRPARIEGHSRVQLEARAVGAVPVSLRSNRYAFGMDQDGGAVLVDSVEEMAAAIDKLLAVPEQLQSLSSRAVATARAQMDWSAFVARIGEVLDRPVARPGRRIGAEVGRVVERFTDHLQEQLEGVRDELGRSEARAHGLAEEVAILRVESEERATALRRSAAEGQALREQLAQAQSTLRRLAALERRRSVRLALRLAEPFRPLFRLRDRLRARRGRS